MRERGLFPPYILFLLSYSHFDLLRDSVLRIDVNVARSFFLPFDHALLADGRNLLIRTLIRNLSVVRKLLL